jgi:hypothetical protein
MFSKNYKNNYICGTLKTHITTIVTIEFGLEEEEKPPSHP